MKKLKNNLGSIILIVILTIIVLFVALQKGLGIEQPMLFNYGISYMSSDNMGEALPKGSIMLLHKQDSYDVKDIISYSFDLDEKETVSVTNRIAEIIESEYHVQGDATDFLYPFVKHENVYGKVVFSFPAWILIIIVVGLWLFWTYKYIESKKTKTKSIDNENSKLKSSSKESIATSTPVVQKNEQPAVVTKRAPKRVHIDMSYVAPKTSVSTKPMDPNDNNFTWQAVTKESRKTKTSENVEQKPDVKDEDVSSLILSIENRFNKAKSN